MSRPMDAAPVVPGLAEGIDAGVGGSLTQRLQCSSLWVMTYIPLRDYNLHPKRELHLSLWVCHGAQHLEALRVLILPLLGS